MISIKIFIFLKNNASSRQQLMLLLMRLKIGVSLMEYEVMKWEDIVKKALALCDKIKKSGFSPDYIVLILRGGATPASILSDCLGIRNVLAVKAELYEEIGKPGKNVNIIQPLPQKLHGKKVLIVDDVSDTGATLKVIVDHLKSLGASEVRVATIHYKPWSEFMPDYFIEETTKWIVYPWEYHEFIREISRMIETGKLRGDEKIKAERALNKVQLMLKMLES